MDKYLLTIPGSSVDSFYESDTYPIEGDFSHARFICNSAGGCPLNVGAVCASKGMKVKTLEMLGEDDDLMLCSVTQNSILKKNRTLSQQGVRSAERLMLF